MYWWGYANQDLANLRYKHTRARDHGEYALDAKAIRHSRETDLP